MFKKHAFFVVLALAVAVNQLVLSTATTVDEKSEVIDRDEERGEEAVKLMGTEIAKVMTLLGKRIVVVPKHVKPTGQILSEGEQGAHPQMIRHEGNPPQNIFKLFGATIASPNLVPEAVAQRTSQGNIRNQLADDLETTAAEKVGRGVKRKVSSSDEAQRRQIDEAQRKVQKVRANFGLRGKVPEDPKLFSTWGIDVKQLEKRKQEISKQLEQRKKEVSKSEPPDKLQLSEKEVHYMAVGSIYFERELNQQKKSARRNKGRMRKALENMDDRRLAQLGVDREKVAKRVRNMFHNEESQARVPDILYMAMGMEFYRPPPSRG